MDNILTAAYKLGIGADEIHFESNTYGEVKLIRDGLSFYRVYHLKSTPIQSNHFEKWLKYYLVHPVYERIMDDELVYHTDLYALRNLLIEKHWL